MKDNDVTAREAKLDRALADSFPASDPPSFTPVSGVGGRAPAHQHGADTARPTQTVLAAGGNGRRAASRTPGKSSARVGLRRAYEPPGRNDGYRVLVDGVWPRGVSRDELKVDEWNRDVPPSAELRRWYGHVPVRWEEFRKKYLRELSEGPALEAVRRLTERARERHITLVVGAKDSQHSQGAVLRDLIEERLQTGEP